MKVLQLPDVLHEYLVHVIEKHAASGIHPEEGLAVSKLWEAITKHVTHVPDTEIARMVAAGTAAGQSTPTAVKVEAAFAHPTENFPAELAHQRAVYTAHAGDPGDEHADSEHSEIIREITGH